MLLTHLSIKNFRGIEELSLALDDLCVFIGVNNAGKSSILDAIQICMTRPLANKRSAFDKYDYHLAGTASSPEDAPQIEITPTFAERAENDWPDEVSRMLADAEQVGVDSGLRSVTLRVTGSFDSTANNFVSDYNFLDLSGEVLPKAKRPQLLMALQGLAPTFYLASLRDAAREFQANSKFWGPFVRGLELDGEERSKLEAALVDLNQRLLDQHSSMESVKKNLKKTAELLPLDEADPVQIEVLPSRVSDIMSRTQINLASKTGAKIPIVRHGSGTQSLAVICLFQAFLESRLQENYGEHTAPMLALEEPEAHLHPSAVRAVGAMLQDIPGQKLISTHSGDLLAGVPLDRIYRLRRVDGKVQSHRIDENLLTEDEPNKLNYHIRATRGNLLFSHCWLLVEGQTEATLIPECAKAMGLDLYAKGVCCIEFAQARIESFIKFADALGIEWLVLADNDQAGDGYARSAQSHLNTRKYDDHIRVLEHGAIELFLCMEGFGDIYEETISDQKDGDIPSGEKDAVYWDAVLNAQQKKSKPRNALAVAERILAQGEAVVPQLLKDVIEQAIRLAEGAE